MESWRHNRSIGKTSEMNRFPVFRGTNPQARKAFMELTKRQQQRRVQQEKQRVLEILGFDDSRDTINNQFSNIQYIENDQLVLPLNNAHVMDSSSLASDDNISIAEPLSLRSDLCSWMMQSTISDEDVTALLKILRSHGHEELPEDAQDLIRTASIMDVTVEDYNGEVSEIQDECSDFNVTQVSQIQDTRNSSVEVRNESTTDIAPVTKKEDMSTDSLVGKLNTVLGRIETLSSNVASIQIRLSEIESRKTNDVPLSFDQEEIKGIVALLPIRTIDDLKEIELLLNENNKSSFVKYLRNIGGTNMKELTIRILKSCFSNQFGMGCSWLGLRGNLAVSKLKITKSIKDAVSSKYTIDIKEFEKLASDWIRLSRQRFIRERLKNTVSPLN